MSKSGLFAHFGSKQELQLETIKTARGLLRAGHRAGLGRTRTGRAGATRRDNFLRSSRTVYPGGCFFASVAGRDGHAARPGSRRRGPGRGRALSGSLEAAIRHAQAEGRSILRGCVPARVDNEAYLSLANAQFAFTQASTPINRARSAVERRLAAAAPAADQALR